MIGHTGSLNGVKNQELILDTAGILKANGIPVKFYWSEEETENGI